MMIIMMMMRRSKSRRIMVILITAKKDKIKNKQLHKARCNKKQHCVRLRVIRQTERSLSLKPPRSTTQLTGPLTPSRDKSIPGPRITNATTSKWDLFEVKFMQSGWLVLVVACALAFNTCNRRVQRFY